MLIYFIPGTMSKVKSKKEEALKKIQEEGENILLFWYNDNDGEYKDNGDDDYDDDGDLVFIISTNNDDDNYGDLAFFMIMIKDFNVSASDTWLTGIIQKIWAWYWLCIWLRWWWSW